MDRLKNSEVVGIDLGTTSSEIAILDDTGQPKLVPNLEGDLKTPSVVYFGKNGDVLVGITAQSMLFVEPERTVKEAKRDVGSGKIYFSDSNLIVTPELCQAEVLKHLRRSIIQYSGDKQAGRMAVVTVPAYFKENDRQSVIKSCEMAGIQVMELINEPTAAGLSFRLNEKQGDFIVLVVDFGGGTFDVSLIEFSGGRVNVLATSGDRNLGGKDIDNIMLKMIFDKFKKDHGIEVTSEACPGDYYGIWEEVVRKKQLLSSKNEVRLIARAQGKQIMLDIARDTFNQEITPIINRIKKLTLGMMRDAKVNMGDVKYVLPIGGSSRIPQFRKVFEDMFGTDSIIGGKVSPDLAVASGAVIKAVKIASKSGNTIVDENLHAIPTPPVQSTDVMPHSLGIAVQDKVSSAIYCSTILEKNNPIPCRVSKFYASVNEKQTKFLISVVQGENGQAISDCLIVGEKVIDLPARDSNKESLEVDMGYDESGMVDVIVKDLVSHKQENITIDFYAQNS